MAKIFYRNVYGLKKSKNYHFLSNTQRKQRFLFPKWNFVQFSVCLFVCLFVCLSHFSKNSNHLGPSFPSQITSQSRNQLLFLRKPIAGCDLKTQKTRFLVTADRTSAIKFQLKSWINNIFDQISTQNEQKRHYQIEWWYIPLSVWLKFFGGWIGMKCFIGAPA